MKKRTSTKPQKQAPPEDIELIKREGGVTALARKLGYTEGGAQRVQNWLKRGIPPAERLKHPDVLMPNLVEKQAA